MIQQRAFDMTDVAKYVGLQHFIIQYYWSFSEKNLQVCA